MNVSGIEGCCVASNLYNLGGAHGVARARTQREFNNNIREIMNILNRQIICFTNSGQDAEKKFLDTVGFSQEAFGSVWIHKITKDKLKSFLDASFLEDNKSAEEEIKEKLKLIEATLASKFRRPKPPYGLSHWRQFLDLISPENGIRTTHYNHSVYNSRTRSYQYLAGTGNHLPLSTIDKRLIEAYFQASLSRFNLGSIYLLTTPETPNYNKSNCLLNYINDQLGYTTDEYK